MLSLVPTPLITVIMARATPAAMRPYSMAVAAFSSFKNLMTKRKIDAPKSRHPVYNGGPLAKTLISRSRL